MHRLLFLVRFQNPEMKLCLQEESNGTVFLAACLTKQSQKWNLINVSPGHLQIKNAESSKCLGMSEKKFLFTSPCDQAQLWENSLSTMEISFRQDCADDAVDEITCRNIIRLVLNPF